MRIKQASDYDKSLGNDLYLPGGVSAPATETAFLHAAIGMDPSELAGYTHIPEEVFADPVRAKVWKYVKNGVNNTSQLFDLLEPKEHDRLLLVLKCQEVTRSPRHWADHLIDLMIKRELGRMQLLLDVGSRQKTIPATKIICDLIKNMEALLDLALETGSVETHPNSFVDLLVRVDEEQRDPGKSAPLWGWADLDLMTGGLKPGTLVTIGARPSMGKSTFALCAAQNLVGNKIPCLFISLEMSNEQLDKKVFSRRKRVNSLLISENRKISEDTFAEMLNYSESLLDFPLVFGQGKVSNSSDVANQIRQAEKKIGAPVQVVFIDYLGLMNLDSDSTGNQAYAIAKLTRSLVSLARDLGITIVLLSQLNRSVESRSDKRPMMSDLRDSGSIEQDSHAVLLLYRDSYYNVNGEAGNTTEVIIAKNREGVTGTVELVFDGEHSDFKSKL